MIEHISFEKTLKKGFKFENFGCMLSCSGLYEQKTFIFVFVKLKNTHKT